MEEMILTSKKTPIEIALDIDETGHTTARKLYKWLELRQGDYSRWAKQNILKNPFADKEKDYSALMRSEEGRGNYAQDYLLSASFAKKLAMISKSAKGEETRNYFLKVEDALAKVANSKVQPMSQLEIAKLSLDMLIEQEKRLKNMEEKQLNTENEIKEINAKLEKHQENWYTVAGYASLIGLDVSLNEAGKLGKKASKIARNNNVKVDKTNDPRFGTVNVYPRWILEQVFDEY